MNFKSSVMTVKGQKAKEREGQQDGHRQNSQEIRGEEKGVLGEMIREVERQVIV